MNTSIHSHLTQYGLKKLIEQMETEIVIQVLDIMKLPSSDPDLPARFRVTISDGFYKIKVVFGSQAGQKISENQCMQNSVIQTREVLVSPNPSPNKPPLIIVMRVRVLVSKLDCTIGNAVQYCYGDLMDYSNSKGENRIPAYSISRDDSLEGFQNGNTFKGSPLTTSNKPYYKKKDYEPGYASRNMKSLKTSSGYITNYNIPTAKPGEIHYVNVSQLLAFQDGVSIKVQFAL